MTAVFSLPAPTLAAVARRVGVEYLGTRSGEKFLLVTDESVAPPLAEAIL